MIISNIDVFGTSVCPAEHDSPLIVDPDAVKTFVVSLQSLQPVSRRGRKITQPFGIIQHVELPSSRFRDTNPPETLVDSALPEEPFDGSTGETLDRHSDIIPQLGIPSKGKVRSGGYRLPLRPPPQAALRECNESRPDEVFVLNCRHYNAKQP